MYNVTVKNGLTTQEIECDTLTEVYNLEARENLEIVDYKWVEEYSLPKYTNLMLRINK